MIYYPSPLPVPVRVGIEASGTMNWFLGLMAELGIDNFCWCLRGEFASYGITDAFTIFI